MYTVKANLLPARHMFASYILSKSFNHWSATSGLVFLLNFTGWCFRKSSILHSLIGDRGTAASRLVQERLKELEKSKGQQGHKLPRVIVAEKCKYDEETLMWEEMNWFELA